MSGKKSRENYRITVDFTNDRDLFCAFDELMKRYRIKKAGILRMAFQRFIESELGAIAPTPVEQEPKREKRRVEEKVAKVESNPYGLGPDDDDFAEL
jgi:hypothetical protein